MFWVILCAVLFVLMIVYPFWPGYKELKEGQDNENLYIKKEYVKDPRYFGKSFRGLLDTFLVQVQKLSTGEVLEIDLSKKELLVVGETKKEQNYIEERLTIFLENAVLPANAKHLKEIYALKNLTVGALSRVRAIACNGDCHLHEETEVIRWVDAEGELVIDDDCNLGISASSKLKLSLRGKLCVFKRLFAPIIEIGKSSDNNFNDFEPSKYPEYDDVEYEIEEISEQVDFINNIVTHKALTINRSAVVVGNIKGYKEIFLSEDVKIFGNIFCEGDLIIQNGCNITGTVFVQGCLKVCNDVTFGENGKLKSVIVRKNILFGNGVVIHGFVLTEGVGKTV